MLETVMQALEYKMHPQTARFEVNHAHAGKRSKMPPLIIDTMPMSTGIKKA